jgi:hypothetical protein
MKAKNLFLALTLFGALVLPTACSEGIAGTDEALDELKSASAQPACCMATGTITAEEAAGLLFMYEEEKMARDVYAYFATKYTLPVFRNITKSEQVHMNVVKNLIVGFKVEDGDILEKGAGEFVNTELAELYTTLKAQGDASLKAALEVGVLIEEVDIEDLETQLLTVTNQSIKTVYTNLLAASKVHLKAFSSKL